MTTTNLQNRTIFCRDNIDVLQGINSNSIDLIYLDPPFNKNKVFTAPIGSSAEGASFRDWFREEDVKDEWVQTIKEDYIELHNFLTGIKTISSNKYYLYNYCYLSYMAIRLIEMKRILKDTGSIYLHCDPTMSHYIKLLMDIIFGEKNFRNEINWHYAKGTNPHKDFRNKHDIIFRYSKTKKYLWNQQTYPHLKSQISRFNLTDENGRKYRINHAKDKNGNYINKRYYLDDGVPVDDVWSFLRENKFDQLPHNSKEYTGYPTQKPLVLLERIIKASSNERDIVLDPFCGCATTCVAAEKLNRKWIGIDVSHLAFDFVRERLQKEIANPENILQYQNEIYFSTTPPKRTDTDGDAGLLKKYVYVISNPKYKGRYKVGIANDYKARLNSYQTSDPFRGYKLEYKIHTPLFREVEKYIHEKFNNMFEWVKADLKDIINEIENYKL